MTHNLEDRLSRITTVWELLNQVHADAGQDDAVLGSRAAQQLLLERYNGAVTRYLMYRVRDSAVAQELAQEFAIKLFRGEFHRVSPERGRFRHYVMAVVSRLIKNYYSRKQRGPKSVSIDDHDRPTPASETEMDREFVTSWRDELLARTWNALQESYSASFQVLRFRADHPDLSSTKMAEELQRQSPEQQLSAATVRQILRRARERFAEFLIDEIAASLETPTLENVQEELIELDLLRYCKPILERRRDDRKS